MKSIVHTIPKSEARVIHMPKIPARAPLIALLGVILLAALWAALVRIGWEVPALPIAPASQHGALMVSGFLGALISLERAVALKRRWTYAVPVLAALGALSLLLGLPAMLGRGLMVLAAAGLVGIFIHIFRLHPSIDTAVMGVGSVLWLIGNALWWMNLPVYRAVPWWVGFLVLTIAGERLELSRVLRPTRQVQFLFAAAVGLFIAGLVTSLVAFELGVRVSGAGLLTLAIWLLRHDIARRTIRKSGLTRFIAACLLPGYIWMILGGGLWLMLAHLFVGGMAYDAMLHTLLLGFVFSMIFGHAPIILPAVLNVPIEYTSAFYRHLVLLHGSLILRVAGDLAQIGAMQKWGGLLNIVAVLLFLANTVLAVRRGSSA